jgi:hypothetical protein
MFFRGQLSSAAPAGAAVDPTGMTVTLTVAVAAVLGAAVGVCCAVPANLEEPCESRQRTQQDSSSKAQMESRRQNHWVLVALQVTERDFRCPCVHS